MKLKLIWMFPLISICLTACGGGGGGDSTPSSSSSRQSSTSLSSTSSVSSVTSSSVVSSNPSSVSMSSLVSSTSSSSPSSVSSSSTSSMQSSVASSSSYSAGWKELNAISGDGAGGAQAVLDAVGNALVVWRQIDANLASRSLWFRRYNGTSWGEAQLIEQTNGEVDTYLLVNNQQTGNAMLIWKQFTSTQYDLWVSTFNADTGWSTPVNIETNNGAMGDFDLAMDSQNNAVAVWAQIEVIGRFSIYANRYSASSGWGTATLIENVSELGRQDGSPRVVSLSGGDAEVVWMKSGTNPRGIWHNKLSASSGWGTASELVTDNSTAFTFDFPRLVSSGNGIAYLFWGQADFANSKWTSGLLVKTYAGGWGQANTQVEPKVESDSIFKPYVKLSATNKGLVLRGGEGQSILANLISDGELGGVLRIKPVDNLDIYSEPVVAVDAAGNGFVTWTQKAADLVQRHMYLVPYSVTTGWKPAIITGNSNSPVYDSFIAMNEQGKAILVWTDWSSSQGTKIFARYYTN
jgi:hypothetical protein